MADLPLINGRRYSYTSIESSLILPAGTSEIFIDMQEISYADALEVAFVEGTAQGAIGWTAGVYRPEDSSLKIGKSSFQRGIVEAIGDGWLGSVLLLNVKYSDEGEPLTVDSLTTRIISASDSYSVGPDPLAVTLGLKTIKILRNGIKPIKGL
jgi:hypothetical protein